MAEKKKTDGVRGPCRATRRRHWKPPWRRSRRPMARGPSCAWGTNTGVVVEAIPTGSLALDLALGIGGVPRGGSLRSMGRNPPARPPWPCTSWPRPRSGAARWPSSTRSTPWTPPMPGPWGWTSTTMLISQPDTGEQGLEICEALVRSGAIDVVVVDSVAALVPRAEIEGDMGDCPCGPAGPADEPGPAEAGRLHLQDQLHRHLHQPAPGKGGRDVRQPGGHHRRPGPEVLRLRAH